jgi:hypothetical protein
VLELSHEQRGVGDIAGDADGAGLEQDGEGGDEVALGDAVPAVGDRGGLAGGDEDGDDRTPKRARSRNSTTGAPTRVAPAIKVMGTPCQGITARSEATALTMPA